METKKHVFSLTEKHIFKDILTKYDNIVESKQTDRSILKAKKTVWDHITREYNANPTTRVQASTKQLRRLWMNMKQRQRDALRKECQYRLANGTGLASDSARDQDITSLLTPELHLSVSRAIDPETSPEMDNEVINLRAEKRVSEREIKPEPQDNDDLIETSDEADTSHGTSPIPQPNTRPPYFNWTTEQKKNFIEREYQDRKQRAQEIHQMEMEIMKERLREAKAKADLAEFLLQLQCQDARQEDID